MYSVYHTSQMINDKTPSYCQILQVLGGGFFPPERICINTGTGILAQISHCEFQEVLVSAVLPINRLMLSGFNSIKPWTVPFLFHVRRVLFEFHRSQACQLFYISINEVGQ